MRYLVIFLILIGFSGVVLAQESSDSPIPEPEQDVSVSKNCGPGTTYQNGICLVNETEEKSVNSDANRWTSISPKIDSPLKQIKSGIKFHNVECKEGLELVYKKGDDTSACVKLFTEIELVIRGWAEDNRVLLGCTGERISKCYPDNTREYRKALYDYYFGSDEGLPTYKDLNISKMRTINACTSKPTICYGELENGTELRILCDYPTHGCGVRSFDNYKKVENEN